MAWCSSALGQAATVFTITFKTKLGLVQLGKTLKDYWSSILNGELTLGFTQGLKRTQMIFLDFSLPSRPASVKSLD